MIGMLLLMIAAASIGALVLAVRPSRRAARLKRRQRRAAQHVANVRLWNKLFARRDQRRLTDQRALVGERSK